MGWLSDGYFDSVALRKESVDRNILLLPPTLAAARSLSARRVWIEILAVLVLVFRLYQVALRKESVDRNCVYDDLE